MDQSQRLTVYQAQTNNVKEINKVRKQINRAINASLKRGDKVAVQALTKTMALVFCAWVEANFSKVIHTPYGFSLDEIQQIKKVYKENGVEKGWEKCIELGTLKASKRKNSNYVSNIRLELKRLIQQYIVEPSLLRNKISHGQWAIALNRENTAENKQLTNSLAILDVVVISKWFKVHGHISQIVESLVESPNQAFHKDYWVEIAELREFIAKTENWSIEQKVNELKQKPERVYISK
jgi:hypothetical protein